MRQLYINKSYLPTLQCHRHFQFSSAHHFYLAYGLRKGGLLLKGKNQLPLEVTFTAIDISLEVQFTGVFARTRECYEQLPILENGCH